MSAVELCKPKIWVLVFVVFGLRVVLIWRFLVFGLFGVVLHWIFWLVVWVCVLVVAFWVVWFRLVV